MNQPIRAISEIRGQKIFSKSVQICSKVFTLNSRGDAAAGRGADSQRAVILRDGVAALGSASGDVSGNGFTIVNPVPEPTSLALFGLRLDRHIRPATATAHHEHEEHEGSEDGV